MVDPPFPQIPLFYNIVYLATPPVGLFGLPQNFRDIVTGKTDYNFSGAKSLLNDQVSP